MPPRAKKAGESIAAAEAVTQARRQRWNPLRTLTPETLTRALDAFEYGDLREFALLAEVISDRDDTLKSVKPKREKAVSGRDWKILKREKSPEAEKHQKVLEEFWQNVRAENAYDRNERGGMGKLIKQMMSSVSYRYAVHHIVWKPQPGKLRAVFEFVPLWFFENREGRLRFLKDGGIGIAGEELADGEWMVTTGDGLMIACAIQYLGKRYCTQDWLAFSEKFSMPGLVGATSAAKGSPEGLAMKAAVEAFGQDWSAVMYGVQDPTKPPIHLVQPNGNPSAMPMPAFIERADRKMAALYMGADLSSMSSKDGQGTGASLQAEEKDGLISDDCMTLSETLQEVEREVIRWHFGKEVEPLAYIEIQPPVAVDKKFILEAIKILTEMGVRLPVTEILESLGFSEADADDAALGDLGETEDDKTEDRRQEKNLNRKGSKAAEKMNAEGNAYDPNQPRVPGGDGGGQWVKGGGGGGGGGGSVPITTNEEHLELAEDPEKNRAALQARLNAKMENIPEHAVEFRQLYGQMEISVYGPDDLTTPKVLALLSTKADSISIDTVEAAEDAKGKGYGKALYLAVARLGQENVKESITGSASEDAIGVRNALFPTIKKQQDDLVFATSRIFEGIDYTPKSFRSSEDEDYNVIPLSKRFASSTTNSSQPLDAIRAALSADLQPIGEALAGALQAGDLPAMQAALRKISKDMPDLAGDAGHLSQALSKQFTEDFLTP